MPDFNAIGDAITGGVLGRAVEPKTGDTNYSHETHCLNCGAELLGPYCSACGQHAHVHRSLKAFFHDLLHGVLHFEGKTWRTLPMLVWKPGEITRNYIDGQRARFVSPIALFLFFVFLTFAVMSFTGGLTPTAKAREGIASEIKQNQHQLAVLVEQRAKATGPVAKALDEQIGEVKGEISALQTVQDKNIPVQNMDIGEDGVPDWLVGPLSKAKDNPELLIYKIKTNAYKFSWALIPISVPFVWLLFPFSRRFRLYDHTVFVTYSLCFMMLLLVTASLVGLVSSAVESIAWLIPPIHMYRQLRGTYSVGRFGAVWRTIALTIFAFIAISLFASLLVGLGAFD
jgi:hypothetical protein